MNPLKKMIPKNVFSVVQIGVLPFPLWVRDVRKGVPLSLCGGRAVQEGEPRCLLPLCQKFLASENIFIVVQIASNGSRGVRKGVALSPNGGGGVQGMVFGRESFSLPVGEGLFKEGVPAPSSPCFKNWHVKRLHFDIPRGSLLPQEKSPSPTRLHCCTNCIKWIPGCSGVLSNMASKNVFSVVQIGVIPAPLWVGGVRKGVLLSPWGRGCSRRGVPVPSSLSGKSFGHLKTSSLLYKLHQMDPGMFGRESPSPSVGAGVFKEGGPGPLFSRWKSFLAC